MYQYIILTSLLTLVLADRSSLSTVRYPLLEAAYGILLVTRCLLISVHRSSVADLYALLANQLSLLTAR